MIRAHPSHLRFKKFLLHPPSEYGQKRCAKIPAKNVEKLPKTHRDSHLRSGQTPAKPRPKPGQPRPNTGQRRPNPGQIVAKPGQNLSRRGHCAVSPSFTNQRSSPGFGDHGFALHLVIASTPKATILLPRAQAAAGLPEDFQLVPTLNFRNFVSEEVAERNLALLDSIYASVQGQAGNILSPEELAKFDEFRRMAINNNRLALTLNRRLMGPSAQR